MGSRSLRVFDLGFEIELLRLGLSILTPIQIKLAALGEIKARIVMVIALLFKSL